MVNGKWVNYVTPKEKAALLLGSEATNKEINAYVSSLRSRLCREKKNKIRPTFPYIRLQGRTYYEL